jgi:hypothetical protein
VTGEARRTGGGGTAGKSDRPGQEIVEGSHSGNTPIAESLAEIEPKSFSRPLKIGEARIGVKRPAWMFAEYAFHFGLNLARIWLQLGSKSRAAPRSPRPPTCRHSAAAATATAFGASTASAALRVTARWIGYMSAITNVIAPMTT